MGGYTNFNGLTPLQRQQMYSLERANLIAARPLQGPWICNVIWMLLGPRIKGLFMEVTTLTWTPWSKETLRDFCSWNIAQLPWWKMDANTSLAPHVQGGVWNFWQSTHAHAWPLHQDDNHCRFDLDFSHLSFKYHAKCMDSLEALWIKQKGPCCILWFRRCRYCKWCRWRKGCRGLTFTDVDVDDVCDIDDVDWNWCKYKLSWCRWCRWCKECKKWMEMACKWIWQQFFGKNPLQELSGTCTGCPRKPFAIWGLCRRNYVNAVDLHVGRISNIPICQLVFAMGVGVCCV